MDASPAPRSKFVAPSLALLMASLITLYAGSFIQFDDTSGFGSEGWVIPLGLVAGVLALAAVGVGLSDRTARRGLGGALVVLDVVLVAQANVNDGFRFIWSGEEGELFYLQTALALAALFLLTPTFLSTQEATEERPRRRRSLTGWARVGIYVSALALGMLVAFVVGTAHFESSQCTGPDFGGECDLAALEGLLWAGGVFVLGTIAIVIAEVSRSHKRRAARGLDGLISA